jgi:hypothetical protein
MSLGLFRKSLALHQWIADKVDMEIDLRRKGMVSCDACAYDTIYPPRKDLYAERLDVVNLYGGSSALTHLDYVRNRAFELVAEQCIKDVPGSVAELGVFTGRFSRLINYCLPDRKLFLYDTFEGFDDRDVDYDIEKRLLGDEDDLYGSLKMGWAEAVINFSKKICPHPENLVFRKGYTKKAKTVTDFIKKVCPHPENLIFRKGYFPETAAPDEAERFAFVSIDPDLYKPTYAGLEFFYPRMQGGGSSLSMTITLPIGEV